MSKKYDRFTPDMICLLRSLLSTAKEERLDKKSEMLRNMKRDTLQERQHSSRCNRLLSPRDNRMATRRQAITTPLYSMAMHKCRRSNLHSVQIHLHHKLIPQQPRPLRPLRVAIQRISSPRASLRRHSCRLRHTRANISTPHRLVVGHLTLYSRLLQSRYNISLRNPVVDNILRSPAASHRL